MLDDFITKSFSAFSRFKFVYFIYYQCNLLLLSFIVFMVVPIEAGNHIAVNDEFGCDGHICASTEYCMHDESVPSFDLEVICSPLSIRSSKGRQNLNGEYLWKN
jgi:hypothetical protein